MSDFLLHLQKTGQLSDYFPRVSGRVDVPNIFDRHSTTVVGLRYRDGVMLGADSQATDIKTLDRFHEPVRKIFLVNQNAIVGIAGAAGIAQGSARLFRITCSAEQCLSSAVASALSGEQYELILRAIAQQNFSLAFQSRGGLAVQFLLGVYESGGSRVLLADPTGLILSFQDKGYGSIGSGARRANDFLDDHHYSPDVGYEEALRILVDSLEKAADVNKGTGPPFFVACSDANGARFIEEVNRG